MTWSCYLTIPAMHTEVAGGLTSPKLSCRRANAGDDDLEADIAIVLSRGLGTVSAQPYACCLRTSVRTLLLCASDISAACAIPAALCKKLVKTSSRSAVCAR